MQRLFRFADIFMKINASHTVRLMLQAYGLERLGKKEKKMCIIKVICFIDNTISVGFCLSFNFKLKSIIRKHHENKAKRLR